MFTSQTANVKNLSTLSNKPRMFQRSPTAARRPAPPPRTSRQSSLSGQIRWRTERHARDRGSRPRSRQVRELQSCRDARSLGQDHFIGSSSYDLSEQLYHWLSDLSVWNGRWVSCSGKSRCHRPNVSPHRATPCHRSEGQDTQARSSEEGPCHCTSAGWQPKQSLG